MIHLDVVKDKLIKFKAVEVSYSEAGDFEIVQASFNSECDCPEMGKLDYEWKAYFMFSANFEFPGVANVEWNDGHDFGGGEIASFKLYRNSAYLEISEGLHFEASFELNEPQYFELIRYLKIIFRGIDDRLSIDKNKSQPVGAGQPDNPPVKL